METISKFSLIILTGISLYWQAFLGFNLRNSFKSVSLVTKLKEKDIFSFILMILGCFSYLFIAFKTGSKILRFSVISTKFLSNLRFWVILLKKVLKVSASSWLFVIVLLLSFSIIVSLQNAFSENRGLVFAKISCYQKQLYF